MLLQEDQGEIQCLHVQDSHTALDEAMVTDPVLDALMMIWITKMGAWLAVLPSTVNGTDLGAQEWLNTLSLCYEIDLPLIPTHFYVCNAKNSIFRALDFKKVTSSRLVTTSSMIGSQTF